MTRSNYIIEYTVKDVDDAVMKSGKIRVKNKWNSDEAQARLSIWIKNKYPNFGELVINSCKRENSSSDDWGKMFNNSNPFGF